MFKSAAAVVDNILSQDAASTAKAPPASRPNVDTLARAANRRRMKLRPPEPSSLHFALSLDFIPPGFLQEDITGREHRHLFFATAGQLKVLATAHTWYMDGTFKVVRKPFVQLFTIHAFIKNGRHWKQ